jgi:SH3-like domain-containing protein
VAWSIAGALVLLMMVGGVALALMVGDDDDDTGLATGSDRESGASPAPVTLVTTTSTSSTTVSTIPAITITITTSSTSTTVPQHRSASLYADLAVLRAGADLDASEVERFQDRQGLTMDVLEGPDDGWYRVRVDGREGWMFGSLIVISPSTSGHVVAETRNRQAATLRRSDGTPMGVANASGTLVLVVDDAGPLWKVVLAEGGSAWVDPSEMRVVS